MLWLAWGGTAVQVLGFAPTVLYGVRVLVRDFRKFRSVLITQFDHDVKSLTNLVEWLAGYPDDSLETALRYAQMGQHRLKSRLGMLLGGVRLGVLPVVISFFGLLSNWEDLLTLPAWLVVLGLVAPIVWLIGWLGTEFGRRLELYAFVIEEALRQQSIVGGDFAEAITHDRPKKSSGGRSLPI